MSTGNHRNPDIVEQAIQDAFLQVSKILPESMASDFDVIPSEFRKEINTDKYANTEELRRFLSENQGIEKPVSAEFIREEPYKSGIAKIGKIKKSDWLPYRGLDIYEFEPEFVAWILSGENGFSQMIDYHRFENYIKQAYDWVAEGEYIGSHFDDEDRTDFTAKEIARFQVNTSYYVLKYGTLRDSSTETGVDKFIPYRCQMFVLYLLDCGYSTIIGKLRQIGFSSVIAYYFYVKAAFGSNIKCKFIAKDEKKTKEIFADKLKQPFNDAPRFLFPDVARESDVHIEVQDETTKGRKGKNANTIRCEPPARDSVNGGSPDVVGIDEAAFIKYFGHMILEGRPAAIKFNPKLGIHVLSRQIIAWGTGGSSTDDKSAPVTDDFEKVYDGTWEAWKSGNRRNNLIPVFIDFFSKPGNTKEHYEAERQYYYDFYEGKNEEAEAQFHAHCPVSRQDMFVKKDNTLLPGFTINSHLNRISFKRKENPLVMPQGGYFDYEPDYTKPVDNGTGFEYEIKSVFWVPQDYGFSAGSSKITEPWCYKLPFEPCLEDKYRYFQGTDCIDSYDGKSNFSSTIWDSHWMAPHCILNFRERDFHECYKQTYLMNLYYGMPPHLIENNKGSGFIKYIETMKQGYGTLMFNDELPPELQYRKQGKYDNIGINTSSATKPRIVDRMLQMLLVCGNYIWFDTVFKQLKTFVSRPSRTGAVTTWGPSDNEVYKDDALWSLVFSYICCQVYRSNGLLPVLKEELDAQRSNDRPVHKYIRDNQGNLIITS